MKVKKVKFNFMFLLIIAVLLIMIYFQLVKKEVIMQQSLAQTEIIQPHVDEATGERYITYEDFGATSKEGYDNYQVIKDAHDYANKNNIAVRATLSCYHIYKINNLNPIIISTNTNWNNAKFIIHDEEISEKKTKDYSIFQITSKEKDKTISDEAVLKNITVNRNTKNIKELAGYGDCLCIIYNDKKMQYKRSGTLQNQGKPQQDVFKIDNEGNVLNEIIWDFDNISKITLIPIPDDTVIIQNGNFQTNLPSDGLEQERGYFNRNIACYRSNTIIKNINHTLNDENAIGGPYYGFLTIQKTSDVKIIECQLVAHKYEKDSNYDLIIENTANTEIENVTCKNIEDSHRWGITGSNYTKDITYKNCVLNRIDAHCGIHNLNVEDCQIGIHGITVQGSGELNITNTTSYARDSIVYLRDDYGSSWNGNINIKNCVFKGTKLPRIIYFKISYDGENQLHDYGYDLYLPNLNIDGLTIEDGNVPLENNNIYIYNNNKYFTGNENGEVRNNYILPKNLTIENYQTTTGRKLKLFSNQFYNNLEELGITLSMPLADGKVEIINEKQEEVKDGEITNYDIKIKCDEIEGIETNLKINGQEIKQNEIILSEEDIYKIEVTYQNAIGEAKQETRNITIDKTAPTITGVKQDQTYKYKINPIISDKNLKEVKLLWNGQEVENYNLNSTIQEEGDYQIIATDEAGNKSVIKFKIKNPTVEDYQVVGDKIKNIDSNTEKSEFIQKFGNGEYYDIIREEEILTDDDKIRTGDILKTKAGKSYTLIVTGDITRDGDVNIKDIVKLRKYLLLRNNLDDVELLAADTNLDGKDITIKDLVRMRIIVLEKE